MIAHIDAGTRAVVKDPEVPVQDVEHVERIDARRAENVHDIRLILQRERSLMKEDDICMKRAMYLSARLGRADNRLAGYSGYTECASTECTDWRLVFLTDVSQVRLHRRAQLSHGVAESLDLLLVGGNGYG
jgi:hypothetical protein